MIGFTEATPVAELAGARAAGDGRRRLGSARRADALAAAPAGVAARRARRPPGHRRRRRARHLLGRQAARRPAGRHHRRTRRSGRRDRAAPARTCDARRQAHPRRAPDRRRWPTSPATRPDPALAHGDAVARRRSATERRPIADAVGSAKVVDTEAVAGGGSLPGLGDPVGRRRARRRRRRRHRSARCASTASWHGSPTAWSSATCAPSSPATTPRWSPRCARHRARRRRVRVVATAGHVDHGKSSLVLALTGTDPDRFAEEKARGLTIDLGLRLHRRCRRAERSASSTCPATCASSRTCSPAWARSTSRCSSSPPAKGGCRRARSTCASSTLLGVRHGIVALTKADTVSADDARRRPAARRGRAPGELVATGRARWWCATRSPGAGSTTCDAPSTPSSPPRPRREDLGRPRLWIDRVFAPRGAGTVVTGTLPGGSVAVDDDAARSCGSTVRARVRGIESAHRRSSEVKPGTRVAFNLVGVERQALMRGDALVRAGPVVRCHRGATLRSR